MFNSEALYPHLPISLQNAACTLRGLKQRRLRFGGDFWALYTWLLESEWWDLEAIRAYQDEQLRNLVRHAYQTTVFYRRRFDEAGVRPDDIQTRSDLQRLPLLTKEDVRHHLREMVSNRFKQSDLVHGHTSGSTGTSLDLFMEPRGYQFRWAVWSRHKQRFGVGIDEPYATFTGLVAVPLDQRRPPFSRVNLAMRQTIFTMHHVTPDKVAAIVERLNQGDFAYYTGYPSILNVLAELIQEQRLEITAPPRIIFTGAENLYDTQRTLISEVFQCPVTDQYGFSEGCGNASRCKQDVFHEDFEYGILECVNPEPIDPYTTRGQIVATGFATQAVPFIRYVVGDTGVWQSTPCDCGRHSEIMVRIEGRAEDFVITPEGRRVQRFDYIFKDAHHVKEAQIAQYVPDRITVRLVRRAEYTQADEKLIVGEIANRVSQGLGVDFEYLDEIEREPNGKFCAVKSHLGTSVAGAVTNSASPAQPSHQDRQ